MTDLPDVKLRGLVNFPVRVTGGPGIGITKANGLYTVGMDVSGLVQNDNISAGQVAQSRMTIWNSVTNSYETVPYALGATAGVASLSGHTGALNIGNGLKFTGDTLEPDYSLSITDASWYNSLQHAVDAVPATGGTLFVGGNTPFTTLDLRGRSLIRFIGSGGWGAGADQTTTLYTSVGAGVERAIDVRDSIGITFEHLKIAGTNAAHDGYLIDWGQSTLSSFSQKMGLKDCVILYDGTSAAVNLYGALVGSYERTLFGGAGTSIAFQNVARGDQLIFSNVHHFRSCDFTPSGTAVPVLYSGEGISFDGCNVQASSSDGHGRFWNTSTIVPFVGTSVNKCAFYDVTAAGSVWATFNAGDGLNITGNVFGGIDAEIGANYGLSIGGSLNGVKGFVIMGNTARFMTGFISFVGTSGAGTHARKGVVGGNSIYGTTTILYVNPSDAEFVNLPNHIAGGGQGVNFFIKGLPTISGAAGDWYSNAGVVTVS